MADVIEFKPKTDELSAAIKKLNPDITVAVCKKDGDMHVWVSPTSADRHLIAGLLMDAAMTYAVVQTFPDGPSYGGTS